jgi:hypothetical protein
VQNRIEPGNLSSSSSKPRSRKRYIRTEEPGGIALEEDEKENEKVKKENK